MYVHEEGRQIAESEQHKEAHVAACNNQHVQGSVSYVETDLICLSSRDTWHRVQCAQVRGETQTREIFTAKRVA